MGDKRNELLLATLQRAGRPLDSDELLAQATELALDHLWTPAHLTGLNRKGVAKRCGDMVRRGVMVEEGPGFDGKASRPTPRYAPAAGYDAAAPVPAPPHLAAPAANASPYEGMTKPQLFALLEVHDQMAAAHSRFMRDMGDLRVKARQRLLEVGLELA